MTAQVAQRYHRYTPQDHAVWAQLYERQMQLLHTHAAPQLLKGRELLGIRAEKIPNFAHVSQRLSPLTGWRIECVDGKVAPTRMFGYLSRKWFPANRNIRSLEYIDFSPGPDAFHDVFGHLPPLTDPAFAGYMQRYGILGVKTRSPEELELLNRLYFRTAEFGLIETPQGLKIYGSALSTSGGECTYAFGPQATRVPLSLERVFETPVQDEHFQEQYFVIESFRQLEDAINSPALLQ